MAGRDLSAELFDDVPSQGGKDLSSELFTNRVVDGLGVIADQNNRGTLPPVNSKGESNYTPGEKAQINKNISQNALDTAYGALRGAASIGATLLTPDDLIAGRTKSIGNPERREAIDSGLQILGANTDSSNFKTAKLGAELAGTAGVPSYLAKGLGGIPLIANKAPTLVNAVRTGGIGADAGNLLTKTVGGAINGAATAGLVNPDNAQTGAIFGGFLPLAAQTAGKVGNFVSEKMQDAAKSLMQSAIKPTIAQLKSGDAQKAVDTLLELGISPTQSGVDKLRGMIWDINDQVKNKIASSTATIDKRDVLAPLIDVGKQFSKQVSPTSDINAIKSVARDFLEHPAISGTEIPVQLAQDMKQGTYSVLSKKYGQIGSAETEAQKALARGLKEQISLKVPEVGALNAQESNLINALNVSERRALMELNKNPVGLATLASNPVAAAGFMADKSALFKSLAARAINRTSGATSSLGGGLLSMSPAVPLIRNAGLLTLENSP